MPAPLLLRPLFGRLKPTSACLQDRAAITALENWTLSFNPAHGLASSIPLRLPPARHNLAATYVRHTYKNCTRTAHQAGDARAGQVLKAMAALQDSDTVTHLISWTVSRGRPSRGFALP